MKIKRNEPTPLDLRLDYLEHAIYYYYRAADSDDNLTSTLHRIAAGQAREKLLQRCLPSPEPEEIIAFARERFAADRLHAEAR